MKLCFVSRKVESLSLITLSYMLHPDLACSEVDFTYLPSIVSMDFVKDHRGMLHFDNLMT